MRGYRFQKSVICSKVRGVYDEVNQVLEGCAAERLKEKYQPVLASLQAGQELAQLLEAKGRRRGTMDFESSEPGFSWTGMGLAWTFCRAVGAYLKK